MLGKAGVDRDAETPEDVEVLGGHQVAAVGEPDRLAHLAHELGVEAGLRRRVVARPHRARRRRVDQLEVAVHALAPGPGHDRLEGDAPLEEEADEPRALDVLRTEALGLRAADEPERLPLGEVLDRLARPARELLEGEHDATIACGHGALGAAVLTARERHP